MSKSVEQRIVEMRFDNQQFEKGVQTTMGTLDKFKQSLKLDGATKGLEEVDKAAKGINMSGLTNAVETVKNRFSALEVIAITALANITNSVVNAGKRLVESFTMEPIQQGFAEYELKMGAVQTIMASTGADIKTVNGYLDELNTYADRTIYSFSDMTQSIGKFTNAGVSLDDAVKAIQGISNEAAVSGANANEASRAMYNFAQALSSGAVKLIDWKSIENANMATVEFKQSLLDTALAMGTVVEVDGKYQTTTTDMQGKVSDLFTATSAFNDSLSAQWMTTDVLVQTLSNYATDVREMTATEKKAYEEKLRGVGYTEEQIKAIEELGQKAFDSAQDVKTFTQLMDTLKEAAGSGWAQTFEILFGDLEEAKVLWTAVSTTIGGFIDQSSKARNDMLQGWKDLGGRQALIESVQNAFSGLMSVVKPVGEAFREIFPTTTSEQLMNLTKGLKEFTSHLKLSDKDSQNLKNTFKGLFAVLDLVKQGIGALVKAVFPMTKGLGSLGSGVLSVTGKIGEWIVSLDQAAKKSDVFNQAIQKFHDKVSPILKSVKGHIDGAVVAIKKFAETHFNVPDTSGLMSVADKLKARIEPFKKIGEVAKEAMGKLVDAFKASAPVLANLGGIIVDALGKVIDGIMKALRGEGFDSLIDLLNGGIVTGIGVGIMKFIKNLTGIGGFAGIIEGFKGAINGAKETLADFQASLKADILMKIAGSIAVLAGSLLVLSLIDSDKLGGALASISILFAELAASMALFDKTLSGQKGLNKFGMAMIEMSAAILVLASALKKIASIDSDKLAGALVSITVLIGEMVAASLALSKWGGKIKTSAVSMILFAEAINVLVKAVGTLGKLDPDKLTKGLVGVGVVMAELAAFMVAAKFGNFKATQGLAIIELAAALLILEESVSGFGKMDIEVIKQGLIGIGAILAEVAVFSVVAGKAKHILSSATALTVIGAAMLIFGKAIKDIGSLSIETIGKGLIGIGGALAAVAVAVNLMPKNMVGIGLGLLEVAAALKIIGSVIQDAGGMKWEEIGKGMVVLAGSMTILAVALNAMKGTLGGASAMLVMSAALAVFTPVLKSLGSMSLAEIGKGLLALAGAFTVLGIAGAVLGPMVPAILGLSGALALLGVAVAACGVGILAFSAGLASLAVSGVAGVTALVAALEILIVGVLGIIANSATAIAGAVKAIVLAIVDVIVECAPPIAEGVLTLIEEVLKSLAEHGPNIVTYLMDFLIGVINAIAARLPELIKAAVNLIGAFFKGVVDALKGIDTNVLLEGIVGIGLLSAIMLALSAVAGLIPGAMAGVLGMGVVIAEMALVLAAVGALAQLPGLKWLIGEGGDLLQGVGAAIGKFVGGIVGGFLGGISAQFPQIGQDLTDFMSNAQGFIEGAKKIDPAMLQGVNALAQTILLLTAANILDGLTKWFTGGTSLVKFGEELAEFGPYFKKYSDEIAGINPEVITASSNVALALAEMASKLPNSGGLAGKIFGENNLSDFGAELEKFGPHIKKYGDQVRGLDAGAVKASAEAAQLLADMAATLPNAGGLAAKIMGDNTLSAFGEELEKFGPHISKYAKDVNGVNPAAVKASAQAAQVLSDMAATLPNSGGLAALIMGDNTLSEFGEELEKFGPHIAKYAQDVAGVQPTVVTASANAAKALSELANNLPNTGGLVSWFTGDNDIGKFGQSLEKFGQSFAGYYNSISGINTSLLDSVIAELHALVDLANGITSVDTSGLTRFAKDLTTMGNNGIDGFIQAFTDANAKVQKSVTDMLDTVISTMQSQTGTLTSAGTTAGQSLGTGVTDGIVSKKAVILLTASAVCQALVQTMQTGLPSNTFNTIGQNNVMQPLINGMSAKRALLLSTAKNHCTALIQQFRTDLPSNTFNTIGQTVIQGIINGMTSKRALLLSTARNLCTSLIQQFRTSLPSNTFNTIGQNVIQALINGMNAKKSSLLTTARNLCTALVSKFKAELPNSTFNTIGQNIVQALANGISSKQGTAVEAAKGVCTAVKNAFSNNFTSGDLRPVGANAAQGLVDGIRSKIDEIADAAIDAAKKAVAAAKKELDEHSPSKVFFKIGENVDLGMVNGIRAYLGRIGDAGTSMGREAIDSMKSAIAHVSDIVNGEMDAEPTIRPVLDLSNVQNGVGKINSLFSKGLDMSVSYNKAVEASRSRKAESSPSIENPSNYQQPAPNTFSFVQNNYSPKSLSRSEIYRQTNNQFSAFRKAVNPT